MKVLLAFVLICAATVQAETVRVKSTTRTKGSVEVKKTTCDCGCKSKVEYKCRVKK